VAITAISLATVLIKVQEEDQVATEVDVAAEADTPAEGVKNVTNVEKLGTLLVTVPKVAPAVMVEEDMVVVRVGMEGDTVEAVVADRPASHVVGMDICPATAHKVKSVTTAVKSVI